MVSVSIPKVGKTCSHSPNRGRGNWMSLMDVPRVILKLNSTIFSPDIGPKILVHIHMMTLT